MKQGLAQSVSFGIILREEEDITAKRLQKMDTYFSLTQVLIIEQSRSILLL